MISFALPQCPDKIGKAGVIIPLFFRRQNQDSVRQIQSGLLIFNSVLLPIGSHYVSCFDFVT